MSWKLKEAQSGRGSRKVHIQYERGGEITWPSLLQCFSSNDFLSGGARKIPKIGK
jgi:hypothetical protein